VRQHKPQAIVEIGMESADRTTRILRLAQRVSPDAELHYTAIDLFDARPSDCQPLKLKSMHQLLAKTNVHVRLIPGDPLSALARAANQLSGTQLLIVSAAVDSLAMAQAWRYVPRMLCPSAVVLETFATGPNRRYKTVTTTEIERRIAVAGRSRRAA